MSKPSKSEFARGLCGRFAHDKGGNIAVLFAIAALPMVIFVGAAVDFTRASAARTAMQSALDSTSLMVSKDIASGVITSAQVSSKALAYFNALYANKDATGAAITATYNATNGSGTSSVSVTGTAQVPTAFMKVAGYSQLDINSASTSTWGGTRMRVALVLDVTGSMQFDGKIAAMQSAANNLVTTLKGLGKTADDVYISVVPFAEMVNVGASNVNANWINWADWDATNGSCSKNSYTTQSTCVAAGKKWTAKNHSNWGGCVTDRDQPYDTTKDAPTSSSTDFPATQYIQSNINICPAQILPLTSTYTDASTKLITDKINSLVAVGGTDQPIGIQMGWQTLQSGGAFNSPAKDSNFKYTDVLIVLSDGLNTIDRWYGNGSDPSPQVDGRQTILCQNINSQAATSTQDYVVYTIQVNTTGDPEAAALKACASSPGNFFPTSSAAGISAAFTSIGTSLSMLRVAQ